MPGTRETEKRDERDTRQPDDTSQPTDKSENSGASDDAMGGTTNPESLTPQEGSIEDYRGLLEELRALSDDELRSRAAAKGIDAPQKMTRDELLAKLMDEPGANEI